MRRCQGSSCWVDSDLSTAQRSSADWTTQTSIVTRPMARQKAKATQIVDTMIDTQSVMMVVPRIEFSGHDRAGVLRSERVITLLEG